MSYQVVDLPAVSGDPSDDVLLLVYDPAAGTNKSRKATRAEVLHDVPRADANVSFDEVTATGGVVTPEITIDDKITRVIHASGSVSIPTAASGAQSTVTVAAVGAVVGDSVVLTMPGTLPAGLICRAYVSSAGVVTVAAFNATGSSISGASYSAAILVIGHEAVA